MKLAIKEDKLLNDTVEHMSNRLKTHSPPRKAHTVSLGTGHFQNASYGGLLETGKVEFHHACHAYINGMFKAQTLWSLYGYSTTKKVALDYLTWLMKESPWSGQPELRLAEMSVNDVFELGFAWDSLDEMPANLLHNFLVASRMCAEWGETIKFWHELAYKHGINKNFAFYMLSCFVNLDERNGEPTDSKARYALRYTDKYDWPLDTGRGSETYLMNFVKGSISHLSKPFFPSAVTQPVNTVWGELVALNKTTDSYIDTLAKLYKDKFVTREKKTNSSFESNFGSINMAIKSSSDKEFGTLTREEVINIIQEEAKRMGFK